MSVSAENTPASPLHGEVFAWLRKLAAQILIRHHRHPLQVRPESLAPIRPEYRLRGDRGPAIRMSNAVSIAPASTRSRLPSPSSRSSCEPLLSIGARPGCPVHAAARESLPATRSRTAELSSCMVGVATTLTKNCWPGFRPALVPAAPCRHSSTPGSRFASQTTTARRRETRSRRSSSQAWAAE